jgi:hypothetical protein
VEKNLTGAGGWLGLLDEMDFMSGVVKGGDVGGGRRFLPCTQDSELWMLQNLERAINLGISDLSGCAGHGSSQGKSVANR